MIFISINNSHITINKRVKTKGSPSNIEPTANQPTQNNTADKKIAFMIILVVVSILAVVLIFSIVIMIDENNVFSINSLSEFVNHISEILLKFLKLLINT